MASMVQHKCIIPNEFSKEARDVRRIWERFIAGEDEQLELLRPVVRDSWLRCREYGVNPGVKSAPIVLSQEEARSVKNDNILCEAAAPVLHFLCEALEGRTSWFCLPTRNAGYLTFLATSKRWNRQPG